MRSWLAVLMAVVLRGACYVLLSLFLWASFCFFHELVHALGHEPMGLSIVAQAMDDWTPLPGLLTAAIVSWFILDEFLSRTLVPGDPARAWVVTMRPFLFGASFAVVGIVLFWALDGRRATWPHESGYPFLLGSVVMVSGLLAGVGAGAISFRGRSWRRLLAIAAPLAVVVSMAACMILLVQWYGSDPWDEMLHGFAKWWTILLVGVGICAVGVSACGFEHWMTGHWARTAAVAFAALWAWAAFAGYVLILPFHHLCLKSYVGGGWSRAETVSAWLVGAAWLGTVIVRLVLHRRERWLARSG